MREEHLGAKPGAARDCAGGAHWRTWKREGEVCGGDGRSCCCLLHYQEEERCYLTEEEEVCGSEANDDLRIVGGYETHPHEYPWQVGANKII